jgi:hypothetical protein
MYISNGNVSGVNQVSVQTPCKPTNKSHKKNLKKIIDVLHCLLYHCIKFQIHRMLRDIKKRKF